jgi:hypothetical protein
MAATPSASLRAVRVRSSAGRYDRDVNPARPHPRRWSHRRMSEAKKESENSVTELSAEEAVSPEEDHVAEAVDEGKGLSPETLTDAGLAADVSDDQH